MITLNFTYPPSANRMWRNVKGKTLKSADYRAWLAANAHARIEQLTPAERSVTFPGHYAMMVQARAPDKRRRDLDNLLKPVGDLLQHVGLVADDCNMRGVVAAWADGPAGLTVHVMPVEA